MPLPGSRVIPANWSEHHRPTVAGGRTATCVITRKGTNGTTHPDGSWSPGAQQVIFEGTCRITRDADDEAHPVIGGRRITTMRYLIEIDAAAPEIFIEDVVSVTAPNSVSLDGRSFRVQGIRITNEEWSRALGVVEFQDPARR